ncbi:hypothetical protein Zm00014a_010421 [Zea mays]|uniref:INO80 complex subunit B-like conserved region domain-containing protein n=1 Tax=Zea mays TaxID=4577 RepID=A0A3L6F4C5_MAIZE|nr:hypothetical protein Zm00014a_010421 [Zea mays]
MEGRGNPPHTTTDAVIKKPRSVASRKPRSTEQLTHEYNGICPPSWSAPHDDDTGVGAGGHRRKELHLNSPEMKGSMAHRSDVPRKIRRDDRSGGDHDGHGRSSKAKDAAKHGSENVLALECTARNNGSPDNPQLVPRDDSMPCENRSRKVKLKVVSRTLHCQKWPGCWWQWYSCHVGWLYSSVQAKGFACKFAVASALPPPPCERCHEARRAGAQEGAAEEIREGVALGKGHRATLFGQSWSQSNLNFGSILIMALQDSGGHTNKETHGNRVEGKHGNGHEIFPSSDLVRKSKRIPKKKTLDGDSDDEDGELRYLEKLKGAKVAPDPVNTSHKAYDFGDDALKKKKLSKLSRNKSTPYEVDDDFRMSRSGRDGRKKLNLGDDNEFIEEEESEMDEKNGLKEPDSPQGVKIETPEQKEKLSDMEVQAKKAEAALRRKMQVEKAEKEQQAEAMRKILGIDSEKKKEEKKLKDEKEGKTGKIRRIQEKLRPDCHGPNWDCDYIP